MRHSCHPSLPADRDANDFLLSYRLKNYVSSCHRSTALGDAFTSVTVLRANYLSTSRLIKLTACAFEIIIIPLPLMRYRPARCTVCRRAVAYLLCPLWFILPPAYRPRSTNYGKIFNVSRGGIIDCKLAIPIATMGAVRSIIRRVSYLSYFLCSPHDTKLSDKIPTWGYNVLEFN